MLTTQNAYTHIVFFSSENKVATISLRSVVNRLAIANITRSFSFAYNTSVKNRGSHILFRLFLKNFLK